MKSLGLTVTVEVLMLLTASGTHIVEGLPEISSVVRAARFAMDAVTAVSRLLPISSVLRAAKFAMDAGTVVSRLFPILRVFSASRFPISLGSEVMRLVPRFRMFRLGKDEKKALLILLIALFARFSCVTPDGLLD